MFVKMFNKNIAWYTLWSSFSLASEHRHTSTHQTKNNNKDILYREKSKYANENGFYVRNRERNTETSANVLDNH